MAHSKGGTETRGGAGNPGSTGANDHRGGSRPEYSPNDDRSIVKNPTSDAHKADLANREKQGRES